MISAPPRPPRQRPALTLLTVAAVCVAAGAVALAGTPEASATHLGDPVIVAAGDIACPTSDVNYNGGLGTALQCRQKHTSDMILDADHVFVLGDGQYTIGSLTQY